MCGIYFIIMRFHCGRMLFIFLSFFAVCYGAVCSSLNCDFLIPCTASLLYKKMILVLLRV